MSKSDEAIKEYIDALHDNVMEQIEILWKAIKVLQGGIEEAPDQQETNNHFRANTKSGES